MGNSLVEDTNYRLYNLPLNNVHLVGRSEPLPESQVSLAERICGPSRTCPEAAAEDCQTTNRQSEERLGLLLECDVEDGFQNQLTKKIGYTVGVQCSRRVHIDFDHVPHKPDVAQGNKLSQPVPDLLYGYKRSLFEQNGATVDSMLAKCMSANKAILMLPFLAIEIKGQWPPSSGNLCVAENQAAGSSSACVKMAEHLNECLEHKTMARIDSTAFSIATNGSEARLFMTWKEGTDTFKVKHLRSYCLAEEDHYIAFHGALYNILDWGYNERLTSIGSCLKVLGGNGTGRAGVLGRRGQDEDETELETGETPCKRQKLWE